MRNYNTGAGWKVLSIFLALVLIAGAVTGLVFWQKGNIEFHKEVTEEPEVSENVIVSPDEGRGMTLSVRSTGEETGQESEVGMHTLQVIGGAVNVDWEIEFADPQSEWATGKTLTDYVELGVDDEDTRTASLICHAIFCEQIIVTATNLDYPAAYATATVDYARRIEDITVTLTGKDSGEQIASAAGEEVLYIPVDDTQHIEVSVVPQYGEGSINENLTFNVDLEQGLLFTVCGMEPDLSEYGEYPASYQLINRQSTGSVNGEIINGGYLFVRYFLPSGYEDNEGLHTPPQEAMEQIYEQTRNAAKTGPAEWSIADMKISIIGERVTFEKTIGIFYMPEMTLSASNVLF